MTTPPALRRSVAAVVLGLAAGGSLLLGASVASAAPARAASTSVTVDYDPPVLFDASLSQGAVTVTVGGSVVVVDRNVLAGVTITTWAAGLTPATQDTAAGGSGTLTATSVGTYAYTVTGPDSALASGAVTGTVTVEDAPSPPPSTTSSPGAGGVSSPKSGPGSSTPVAARSSSRTPVTGGGNPTATASPRAQVYAGLNLPGGLIPFAGLGSAAAGGAQNPLVAPYAAQNGATTGPSGGWRPAAEPLPSTTPPSVGLAFTPAVHGSNRAIGLPAAVTAALLAGLVVTLFRVLLLHPAARSARSARSGDARRH